MAEHTSYGRRTVSGHVMMRLVGYLQKRDVPESLYQSMLEETGEFIAGEKRYPIEAQETILQKAAAFLKDDLLGLKSGSYFRASKFGLYHSLLSVADTFEDDVLISIRYMALETQAIRGKLIKGQTQSRMVFAPVAETAGRHQLECIVRQAAVRLFNTAPPWMKVVFHYDDRGLKSEYERILKCPVVFNAPYTAVCTSTAHLAVCVGSRDDEVRECLEPIANKRLHNLLTETSVVDEVEFQIYQYLTAGIPGDLEAVASNMGMSERNLQKYLQAENTTFRDILNKARIEKVQELIGDDSLSTANIAEQIGFEELSSFYRFIKNMTGESMSELKARLSQG